MAKLQIADGYGLASVQVGDAPAVVLDLWEANNTYSQLESQHADAVELANAWLAWLDGKGITGLSHGAGFAVVDHVTAAMEECKKKSTCSAKPG